MTQLPIQLSLSPAVSRSRRKRGHVPKTSVLAYESMNGMLVGREREVLAWMKFCRDKHEVDPTSAEVAKDAPFAACEMSTEGPCFNDHMTCLLYVRRGLSDLKAHGLVEHVPHGERTCRVSGRKSVTWRVRGR